MNFVILVLLKYTQIEVLVNNIQATFNLVLKAKLFRLMVQRSSFHSLAIYAMIWRKCISRDH